jgi:hypothetical protein
MIDLAWPDPRARSELPPPPLGFEFDERANNRFGANRS